jgi:hypothetical protein
MFSGLFKKLFYSSDGRWLLILNGIGAGLGRVLGKWRLGLSVLNVLWEIGWSGKNLAPRAAPAKFA